ncbi:APC family permease [Ihubacter massiliensis]|uniref:APC family permease n=1 Tax=Hominibacterium faecale TaxID=2839743 RepID=A0A9J6QPF1_9FIRM|nr:MULTISPECIES: APC family permease [Eubacteriales Family XIII. Incertae Sedis]MCI7304366.1 APC family permease [Clostridia bacterium]MCO7124073.1 APC family permease [Ihubacter massiliensis]MCU7379065.1 APC family permease [Hominibacterium faecale]MDY3011365.1 APC family permease [Clostridiales Family XIII bacterium]
MDKNKGPDLVLNNSKVKAQDVKLYTMVFIMYSFCCGGCFGIEEMIPVAGPGMTVLLLILIALFWATPQAMISVELGSAMPYTGGFYKWTQAGLGEFWAFVAGWCRVIAQYVENSSYIILGVGYLTTLIPMSEGTAFIIKVAIILFFTAINLRGIKEVGWVSTLLSMVIIIAFAFVAAVGFVNWDSNPIQPFYNEEEGLFWGISGALAIGMWMYSGYTSVSTLAGDCKDRTVVPKALLIGLPLITLTYLLPTLAGVSATGNWQDWGSGGINYSTVAAMAGPVFGALMVVVAIVGCLSNYNTCMISLSRNFYAIAEDRLAPKILTKVSKNKGIPYVTIVTIAIVSIIGCTLDFSTVITMSVTLFIVDYVLVCLSGIALRKKAPEMERPFKLPFGIKGVTLMLMPVFIVAFIALMINGADYFVSGMAAAAIIPLLYVYFKRKSGGLASFGADNEEVNPRTKLCFGDLKRIAVLYGVLGILGAIASFFLPFYEGSWGPEYYMETYGPENAFAFIIAAVRVLTVVYIAVTCILAYLSKKVDQKQTEEINKNEKGA